jgi:hypothetical protein
MTLNWLKAIVALPLFTQANYQVSTHINVPPIFTMFFPVRYSLLMNPISQQYRVLSSPDATDLTRQRQLEHSSCRRLVQSLQRERYYCYTTLFRTFKKDDGLYMPFCYRHPRKFHIGPEHAWADSYVPPLSYAECEQPRQLYHALSATLWSPKNQGAQYNQLLV